MSDKRTCGICGLEHEPHHDTGRNICVETALTELASLRAAVADRDAAIARAHKVITMLLEYRDGNALNFQLEKADDYLSLLRSWADVISKGEWKS